MRIFDFLIQPLELREAFPEKKCKVKHLGVAVFGEVSELMCKYI